MKDIENLIKIIGLKEIDQNKEYWLVRTQSGDYYQEFYFDNYIAIGWDEISDLEEIINSDNEKLKEIVSQTYPDEKKPGNVTNQICRFVKDMKKGDIVIIPSKGSTHICFGEVVDNDAYTFNPETLIDFEEGMCPFYKRRKVKWIKTIRRDDLDPYLYRLLNSHHTITDANDYSDFIDRSLYSFYKKGDTAHVVFEVQETEKIQALDLIKLINTIISTVDEFNTISNCRLSKEDIDIKINVQSPGPVEFSGYLPIILVIGVATVALVGGGLKFKKTFDTIEGELTSEGLLPGIIKFINCLHNNKVEMIKLKNELKEPIDKLKVKLPNVDVNEVCDEMGITAKDNNDKDENDENK